MTKWAQPDPSGFRAAVAGSTWVNMALKASVTETIQRQLRFPWSFSAASRSDGSSTAQHAKHESDQEQDQHNEEHHLCKLGGGDCDPAKAEHGGNQRDDQ